MQKQNIGGAHLCHFSNSFHYNLYFTEVNEIVTFQHFQPSTTPGDVSALSLTSTDGSIAEDIFPYRYNNIHPNLDNMSIFTFKLVIIVFLKQ